MSESNVLDITLLNDYQQNLGLDVLSQMLDLYISQSHTYLVDIEEAAKLGDNALWKDKCHKMKGAVSSAGFSELRTFVVAIEHNTEESAKKLALLSELKILNEKGVAAFKAWLAEQA